MHRAHALWIVPAVSLCLVGPGCAEEDRSGTWVPSGNDAATAQDGPVADAMAEGGTGKGGGGGTGVGGAAGSSTGGAGMGGSGNGGAGEGGAGQGGAGEGGNSGSGGDAGTGGGPIEAGTCATTPTLEMAYGNGALAIAGNWSSADLAVIARCNGVPLAGQPVHWTVTQGDGAVGESAQTSPAKSWDGVTGSDGVSKATFRQPSGFSQPTMSNQPGSVAATASFGSVDFVVTVANPGSGQLMPPLAWIVKPANAGSSSDLGSGQAGTIMNSAVQVQVVNQYGASQGQPIPNVGIRVTSPSAEPLYCQGLGHSALTGVDGIATCDLQLPSQSGQATFNLSVIGLSEWQYLKVEVTP